MADLSKFKNQKYAYLDQLSTEKLEELLKMDRLSGCDEATSEYFDAIEEVILRREEQEPSGRLSNVGDSWEEFQKQYVAPEGRNLRLFPEDDSGEDSLGTPSDKQPAVSGRRYRSLRKVGLVAAIAATLLAGMVVAQAAGLDVFGRLARWTDEIFQFAPYNTGIAATDQNSSGESNEIHEILQAEVSGCGISGPAVPTHFPDGYTLLEISHGQNDISQGVFCALSNEAGDLLTMDFQKYSDISQIGSLAIEKDGSPVEEYISSTGMRTYIMDNLETTVAAWSWGDWCVTIDGPISEVDMKTMIESIGG